MSNGSKANRAVWTERHNQFLAEHDKCRVCGGTENLRVHWFGEGPRPLKSPREIFRRSKELRDKWLVDCDVICHECWRDTIRVNDHGGGKTGVHGCKCDLCAARRAEHHASWFRIRRDRAHARRERLIEMGVPLPRRRPRREFDKPLTLKEQRVLRNAEATRERREFKDGKVCVDCGGRENLNIVWKQEPGPLASPNRIWSYGALRRAEFLEKCDTKCTRCLRSAHPRGKKKEK